MKFAKKLAAVDEDESEARYTASKGHAIGEGSGLEPQSVKADTAHRTVVLHAPAIIFENSGEAKVLLEVSLRSPSVWVSSQGGLRLCLDPELYIPGLL